MKTAIELLKKLADDLSFDRPYSKEILEIVCEDTRIGILDVIELLQAPPRWETPEQYKERTGEDWPDENAVYRLYTDNDGIAKWYAESYKGRTRPNDRYKLLPVVCCATEAGPPPEDWKPEGDRK